jgi:hypothetical protein
MASSLNGTSQVGLQLTTWRIPEAQLSRSLCEPLRWHLVSLPLQDSSSMSKPSPISGLPDELIVLIFTAGCQIDLTIFPWADYRTSRERVFLDAAHDNSYRRPKDFTRLAMRVCSRWRDLALSAPYLHVASLVLLCKPHWDMYRVDQWELTHQLAIFKHTLESSQGCSLDLILNLVSFTEAAHYRLFYCGLALLEPYASQLQIVIARCAKGEALDYLYRIISKARRLTWLEVIDLGTYDPSGSEPRFDAELHSNHAAEDQSMRFSSFVSAEHMEIPCDLLRSISEQAIRSTRSLTLQESSQDHSLYFEALARACNATRVSLNLTPGIWLQQELILPYPRQTLSHSSVHTLKLDAAACQVVAFLWTFKSMPSLESLELFLQGDIYAPPVSGREIQPVQFPSLRMLTILTLVPENFNILLFFLNLPLLESFKTGLSHDWQSNVLVLPGDWRFPASREIEISMPVIHDHRVLLGLFQAEVLESLVISLNPFSTARQARVPQSERFMDHTFVFARLKAFQCSYIIDGLRRLEDSMLITSILSAAPNLERLDLNLSLNNFFWRKIARGCETNLAKVTRLTIELFAFNRKDYNRLSPFVNVTDLCVCSDIYDESSLGWLQPQPYCSI